MLYFEDIGEACRAVVALKQLTDAAGNGIVKGAELLDRKSLESVNDPTGKGLTAVLTETKADTPAVLSQHIAGICEALKAFRTFTPVTFTDREEEYAVYWNLRAGIFPTVGGTRQPGTTTLIEDVAFHLENLPEATADLRQLLSQHGYDDACIYGHALEGNYHFIINQSFASPADVPRYAALMDEVIKLVVDKYDGSLKAEHGTGRNMAPFVRYEWGDAAYRVMQDVKQLFDPHGLLNPGVIFNADPQCHLKNFKPLPLVNPHVDKCIECGFCEVHCLTCGFTLSSRQRIVVQREIARLRAAGDAPKRWRTLQRQYRYAGNQTCAGDGLCSLSCPMGINVGNLTHDLRAAALPKGSAGYRAGQFTATHFAAVKRCLRGALALANAAHTALGTTVMSALAKALHRVLPVPLWTPAMPKAFKRRNTPPPADAAARPKVVYFPSCINQTMGLAKHSPVRQPLVNEMTALLHKAGYEVIFPEGMENLCCGTIWESKGMMDIADRKAAELEKALYAASNRGALPVLCDQSPCMYRMRHTIQSVKLYEPVEFIETFLADKLVFTPTDTPVAVHVTCSMRKMGLAEHVLSLAHRCSSHVLAPDEVGCCGFAGDKGFTRPEVNAYALRKLRPQIAQSGIRTGYSNSRTCEIGLTTHAGIPYVSIVYLVNQCTKTVGSRQ
jgi:D-lactate dehydrogenase